jgi:FMN phosphatase YigB (HAD superfamily)
MRWVLFDWGGTLMSEDGPLDLPMALWPEVRAIDGARDTLDRVARMGRVGVATNASVSTRGMIETALARVGLREFVSEIFCFTELGVRKSDPAFWRRVLERLAIDPSRVAMVGDSLAEDVIPPRQAGIFSIWFDAAGRQPVGPFDHPVVHELVEVVPILQQLGTPDERPASASPAAGRARKR